MKRLWIMLPIAAAAAGAAPRAGFPRYVLQDRVERPEPFRESPLKVNPPTFRWPAVREAVAYEVQISRTTEFQRARTEQVREAFYRPLEPLEPGPYFWRYRTRTAGGPGKWSASEFFENRADLPRWPVTDWKKLLARVPKAHPRIYLRPAEAGSYREKGRALRGQVENWAKEVDPIIGKEFSATRFQEKPLSPEWNEFQKRVVVRKAAKAAGKQLMDPVTDLCWLWLASGDAGPLQEAKRRVMLATQQDPSGLLSPETSDFANASLVSHSAVAYDLLYDQFSAAERTAIRKMLLQRTAPIFDEMRQASQRLMTAHGWQHVFLNGLQGALALYGEEPQAAEWLELGLRSFVALYPWYGGLDGGSQEGANYYTGTDLVSSLLTRDLFLSAFGVDFAKWNPWYRANPYFLIYAYPPGGIISQFGDQRRGERVPGGEQKLAALRMADLYENGYAADYAARISEELPAGAEHFRWVRADGSIPVRRTSLDTLPAARLFRDVGAVFMHSAYTKPEENVRFEFRSSPYGGVGHSHPDQNSFHIIAYNEPLLIDSGYYTPAGDAHHSGWTAQTKAHNTVLVDGRGQADDTSGYGQIRHFEQNVDWVYAVGTAATAYPDIDLARFDRHVIWLRGSAVQTYVIIDDLSAGDGRPHRFDWLLHARERIQVEEGSRRFVVRGNRSEAVVSLLEPQACRFEQHDRFDVPAVDWRNGNAKLKEQWHLRATPAVAEQQRFVAVIQVAKAGTQYSSVRPVEAGVQVDGWEVRLTHGKSEAPSRPHCVITRVPTRGSAYRQR